ncbi:SCO7613 C-terminal domain-containing membrane protein [Protaetiibacter larvae]|uniref:DUF2157 domain-containing protein n=1 Tax=Protaetiibacter larvae TaxID=2592654 RepID=A0A5C1Y8Y6_9MICO|nr:hypothetical protein [Protaetiibacter larvae]QEO10226.1 hypothetical protein FLP23_09520 [Protaetiibacter larvae]
MAWTDDVATYLLDASACPRCHTRSWNGAPALQAGVCARCGTDLRGDAGAELWAASEAVVDAARRRQQLVDALPRVTREVPSPGVSTAAAAPDPLPASGPATVVAAAPARERSTVSLQSVLAVVGAGLLAVAAIVFTFLNPDLTDFATRTTIIAVTTALFLGGAWLLNSRRLHFSAEAVGALGMVFLALDVWAFSRAAPDGVSAWFFGALGAAVAGVALLALGRWLRLRTWIWTGLVALTIVPAFVGYGLDENAGFPSRGWAVVWGQVAVFFAAWGLLELLRPLGRRLDSRMLADRVTLTVLQLLTALLVIPAVLSADLMSLTVWELVVAAVLSALALGAFLTTRVFLRVFWSAVGGVLTVAAALTAANTLLAPDSSPWRPALLPAVAAAVLVLVALLRRTGSVQRTALVVGTAGTAAATGLPGLFLVLGGVLGVPLAAWTSRSAAVIDPSAATAITAAVLGLAALAVGLWALSRGVDRLGARHGFAVSAAWTAAVAALGIPFSFPGGVALPLVFALGLAAAASVLLIAWPALREARASYRAPLIVLAHLLPAIAVLLSWPEAAVAALTGPVAVAALALAARTVRPRVRPVHTAVGFGYLLVTGAAALSLTALEQLPILCLITTAAAVVAIAASLTSWLPVGSWYALLGVTAVPFGIGVVSVLIERGAWTALSTGVIFLLAATLLLTRREGATGPLRIGAAALLVPTLAVVVVCLTAELPQSGSPYALPIIAVIVACALPTTGILRDALARRGLPAATADAVRLAVEVSSLVTGGIAVILALVRIAAGYEIAFIVLLVLGLGAAATALWLKRRYGWWTAGAAWTGALWCAWAMVGVNVVEPYLLPPAVAAMVVGLVLVARRRDTAAARPAAALFATGLGIAVVPSLAILAITGNGTGTSFDDAPVLWRAYALVAAGVVLTVLAGWVTRPAGSTTTRFEPIRVPLMVGAVAASAAGVVQGARLGWERDPLPLVDVHPMLQVLAFAVLAAATAATVGRLAQTAGATNRWGYLPVPFFLVLGPMTAIENDPTSIWTLWVLELVLLAAMIATAWRARTRQVAFPPVWLQWSLAWVVAVVAWSQREVLRVEGFALPLGLALVLVGALALVRGAREGERRTLTSWPIGFSGSWALLAPGIVATLLPSMLATFTDPQTWRAILVIALALVAVLAGARKTLAAPFILGISALPLEILIVFLVQLGETINPLLWWITLATAGIVLLVIAVGWERRTGADASLGARLRDLR